MNEAITYMISALNSILTTLKTMYIYNNVSLYDGIFMLICVMVVTFVFGRVTHEWILFINYYDFAFYGIPER